jgi:hypothetical protein
MYHNNLIRNHFPALLTLPGARKDSEELWGLHLHGTLANQA